MDKTPHTAQPPECTYCPTTGRMLPPNPEMIKQMRMLAQLTQAEASQLVHAPRANTWQLWESGLHRMPLAAWELFLRKTSATTRENP